MAMVSIHTRQIWPQKQKNEHLINLGEGWYLPQYSIYEEH